MAYRMAIDMGLNLDAACLSGPNNMPREELELRRNIYWGLYCDDKLAAAYTGRVCALPVCSPEIPGLFQCYLHVLIWCSGIPRLG